MTRRKLFYTTAGIFGGILILLVTGYFLANWLIRKKVEERLRALPSSWRVSYREVHANLFGGSLSVDSLDSHLSPEERQLSVGNISLHGISYLALARSRKHVKIDRVKLTRVRMEEKKRLELEGDIEADAVVVDDMDKPMDSTNVHAGAIRLKLSHVQYVIPGAYAKIRLANLRLESRRGELHIDTIRLIPTVDKLELGRIKGHQMDFVEATIAGVTVEGLNIPGLLQKRLIAEKIDIRHSHIYVFRDRRQPLVTDVKPLPIDYLKSLPLSIRVETVKQDGGSFTYEEFP